MVVIALNNKFNEDESTLLSQFNDRRSDAFGAIYEQLFDTMYHFSRKMFNNSDVVAQDVVHDIFLAIWERKSLKFDDIDHLKGYLYLSIRNYVKNSVIKQLRKDKYSNAIRCDDEYFISQMIETEVVREIHLALELLPESCANVFRLFIEGWDTKEIADMLGKSQSTIYNQRQMSIQILRKKLSKNKVFIFSPLFF